jgi:divalent metal cation (Fe/Co/Zn/Cd) transporter
MRFEDLAPTSEDSPSSVAERSRVASRSTWVSVAVNLVLSVGQVLVGLVSGSQGLVADGVHSASDLVADFVVLLASHHGSKDADLDHPYGHQRFETGASLALGLLLLLVGGGMLWAAVLKLSHPPAWRGCTWWPCGWPGPRCWQRNGCSATCWRRPSG